jgi:hypothetical protein
MNDSPSKLASPVVSATKRSLDSPASSVSSKRSCFSASCTTAASLVAPLALAAYLNKNYDKQSKQEIVDTICRNPCLVPFFAFISMTKAQLLQQRGRNYDKQQTNQSTITAQSNQIEKLTIEIENKRTLAAELDAQHLELHEAIVIATEDLENHKKVKEEATLLIEIDTKENRALEVLIRLSNSINRPVRSKPFSSAAVSLKDVQKAMQLRNWEDIVVLSGRKTLACIRILDFLGLLANPNFALLWEQGSKTAEEYMYWVNRNRRMAHISVGKTRATLTMQVRLADYLGIDESDDVGDDEAAAAEMKRRGICPS